MKHPGALILVWLCAFASPAMAQFPFAAQKWAGGDTLTVLVGRGVIASVDPQSGPRYLSATSDVAVLLRAENRTLFALTKAMLSAETPAPSYPLVACERRRLARVYGDSLARELDQEVTYILQSEWPEYWKRFWHARPQLDRLEGGRPPSCHA